MSSTWGEVSTKVGKVCLQVLIARALHGEGLLYTPTNREGDRPAGPIGRRRGRGGGGGGGGEGMGWVGGGGGGGGEGAI